MASRIDMLMKRLEQGEISDSVVDALLEAQTQEDQQKAVPVYNLVKPHSFNAGDPVLVARNGEVIAAAVIGPDIDCDSRAINTNFYVVLLCAAEGRLRDKIETFSIADIYPDLPEYASMAHDRAREALQESDKQEFDTKALRKEKLLSGIPYTRETLKALRPGEWALLLSAMKCGFWPGMKGDRRDLILQFQDAWARKNSDVLTALRVKYGRGSRGVLAATSAPRKEPKPIRPALLARLKTLKAPVAPAVQTVEVVPAAEAKNAIAAFLAESDTDSGEIQ